MARPLGEVCDWLYHLGDIDAARAAEIAASGADLVVIDRTDFSDGRRNYTPADLDALRGGDDRAILSYLSIGEAETYRSYWNDAWFDRPPPWLDRVNPAFTDNIKVEYWDPAWQAIVFEAVDAVVDQGFDGLYLDIIAGFFHFEETAPDSGRDYRADMVDFVGAIRERAFDRIAETDPGRDFVILGQNGAELIDTPGYLAAIDGIGQEDLRFLYDDPEREQDFMRLDDDEYDYLLELLSRAEAAGEEVLVVEYMTPARQSQFEGTLAAEAADLTDIGIALYLAEHRDLDAVYDQSALEGLVPDCGTRPGLGVEDARLVALLYEAGLDRDGDIDLAGLNFWIDRREAGEPPAALAEAFLSSREFAAAFGVPSSLSDRDLVEVLYRNVLDREGEPGGIGFWTGELGRPDFGRPALLIAFANSPENIAGSPFVDDLAEVSPGTWDFVS